MGNLTTVIVGTADTAIAYCQSDYSGTANCFNVASVLSNETLATLLSIVRKEKRSLENEVEVVYTDENGGIIYKIPDPVLEALRRLDENEFLALAKQWKKTDVWFSRSGKDVTAGHLRKVLESLRAASIQSANERKAVYVIVTP
ncbi:hypothetical protein KF728_02680 [Candidatus Obscuribacterales bacterium]|nr:hypothetical protein [Candidatus Obscuribacterales bacterium]MBX3149035.1 hypothetical protein [Candidatus Obscuribacterales bacterium]